MALVDLGVVIPLLLGGNGGDIQLSLPHVSYKNAVIAVLILGPAQKDVLPIHPTINLPIISRFGVWRVWTIITHAT